MSSGCGKLDIRRRAVAEQLFRKQQTVLRCFYRRGYKLLYPLFPRVAEDNELYWWEEIQAVGAANDDAIEPRTFWRPGPVR
jgi:hypothetical protein